MTLPYQPNFDGYERAQGTFESNGEFYRIAKSCVVNDTLYVVLVKDKKEADLFQSVAEFVKANNGDESTSKSPLKMFKSILSEFLVTRYLVQNKSLGWCIEQMKFNPNSLKFSEAPLQLLSPPPEV